MKNSEKQQTVHVLVCLKVVAIHRWMMKTLKTVIPTWIRRNVRVLETPMSSSHVRIAKMFGSLTWCKLLYPACSYGIRSCASEQEFNWNRLYQKKSWTSLVSWWPRLQATVVKACLQRLPQVVTELRLIHLTWLSCWLLSTWPDQVKVLFKSKGTVAQLKRSQIWKSFRAKACGYPICAPNLPNHQWKVSEKSLSSLKNNFCLHDPHPFSQTQFFHCRTLTRALFSPLFCSQLCSRHQDSRFQITFFIKRLHQGLCPTESSINSRPDSFCSALATMTLSMTKRMDCFSEAHHCLADVTDWISASHASQVLNFSCLWKNM